MFQIQNICKQLSNNIINNFKTFDLTVNRSGKVYLRTGLPAAGRSLVGGRIANKNVKPYKKINSLVALKFHPEVLSFDFIVY